MFSKLLLYFAQLLHLFVPDGLRLHVLSRVSGVMICVHQLALTLTAAVLIYLVVIGSFLFLLCAVSLLFTEGLTLFSTIPPVSDHTIPCFDSLFEATCLFHSLLISPIQSLCIPLVLLCAVSLLFTEALALFSTIPPVSNRTIPCFDSLFEETCLLHS